jgi:hypothetical protein
MFMLKPNYNQRKLVLAKQTIRSLDHVELRDAVGGLPTDSRPIDTEPTVGNSGCSGCSFFTFGC